jgi:hypothetical protein
MADVLGTFLLWPATLLYYVPGYVAYVTYALGQELAFAWRSGPFTLMLGLFAAAALWIGLAYILSKC